MPKLNMRWITTSVLMVFMMMALAACGGGVKDTTIPPPPGGTQVDESGDSPLAAFVGAVKPALEPELSKQEVSLDKQTYYGTTTSVAEIESFYEKEMKDRGWKQEETQRQPGILVQTFTSGDTAALIMIVDGSQFASDNIVGAINASKK